MIKQFWGRSARAAGAWRPMVMAGVLCLCAVGCDAGKGPEATIARATPGVEKMPERKAQPPSTADDMGGKIVYDPKKDEMLFLFDGLDSGLTIPRRWQEGDVSVEKLAPEQAEARAYGVLYHPIAAGESHVESLAVIRLYGAAEWSRLRGAHPDELELARLDGRVYSYAAAPTNPLNGGTSDSERYDELVISNEDAAGLLTVKKRS